MEVLLGIRLLGTTVWCGSSEHRAATAQMHSAECEYRRVPTPLRSTSPFSETSSSSFLVCSAAAAAFFADAFSALRSAAYDYVYVDYVYWYCYYYHYHYHY